MEENIEQFTAKLLSPPTSNNLVYTIKCLLDEQPSQTLSSLVSHPSLLKIEQWAWQTLGSDSRQWTEEPNYVQLFHALESLNKKIVIHDDNEIEPEIKAALLIPHSINSIDDILEQIIDSSDDTFLTIVSLWFDRLSHFIHEYPQFLPSPVITHLYKRMARDMLMSDQYKFYLKQLRQAPLSRAIFSAKQHFYIKTCSLSLSVYFCPTSQDFLYTGEEIIAYLADDYAQIVLLHSYTVKSWSRELLGSITALILLICTCCWWGGEEAHHVKMIVSSDLTLYDHVLALIRILNHKPFHECINAQWSTDETILIDAIITLLKGAVETENLSSFIRSTTSLPETLLNLGNTSSYDRILFCARGLLAEILSDEQLKELEIGNDMNSYFFAILEQAWKSPSQKYRNMPILHLLRGLLNLSKNDAIQAKTAQSNKMLLLIEMSDKYPIIFDIFWTLSFNSSAQEQLRSNPTFMSRLKDLANDYSNENMRRIAHGILWNLNSDEHLSCGKNARTAFDVMISYSHKDKQMCKQLYDELIGAGYRVWVDFDQMHGNIMDAMAQAIEQSRIIIICMSEQYRRSNFCRAEAQYAFQLQLKIVPILLQKHYKPDGWLSFLIGQLLYIDFTKHEFPQALDMLMRELKAPHILESNEVPTVVTLALSLPFPEVRSQPNSRPENVRHWTTIHVHEWLIENDLPEMAHLLSDIDGSTLVYLGEYLTKVDTQQIFASFQQDALRRTNRNISVIELSRFRNLIEQDGFLSTKSEAKSKKKRNLIYRCCTM